MRRRFSGASGAAEAAPYKTMADTIDWRPPPQPQRRTGLFFMAIAGLLLLAGSATLSYYVEALWFESLGVADVFWKTLNLRAASLRRLRRSSVFSSSTDHFARSSRRASAISPGCRS